MSDASDPSVEFPKTTMHVRNAMAGDERSLAWVIERLSPLLLAHADYRLGPSLRPDVDPEDLVSEAWVATLPKLGELAAHKGRFTPVVLKFLTSCINFRVGRLLRDQLTGRRRVPIEGLDEVSGEVSAVDARLIRTEHQRQVQRLLDRLSPQDREVLILRGMEQQSSKAVAVLLDVAPGTVDKRYLRALRRLREGMSESVFHELLA